MAQETKTEIQKMSKWKITGPAIFFIGIIAWQALQQPIVRYNLQKLDARMHSNPDVAGLMTFQLQVPLFFQEHTLSCEIAALRMALAAQGSHVSESDLITLLTFDSTLKTKGVWGDPDVGFVGNIDGRMPQTGYGVHWDPIAKLGSHFKRTEVVRNMTAQEAAAQLQSGNPVVVWGYLGKGGALSWRTPAGKEVKTTNGEHARVLTGFTGTIHDPVGFYVNDPKFGTMFWDTERLMENWGAFGHSGVVVYKNLRWVKTVHEETIWEISKDGTTRHKVAMDFWQFYFYAGGIATVSTVTEEVLSSYQLGADIMPETELE